MFSINTAQSKTPHRKNRGRLNNLYVQENEATKKRIIQKKALLIALNYYDSEYPDFGNQTESKNFAEALAVSLHISDISIIGDRPDKNLSKTDIIEAFDKLLLDAEYGDILIFLFLGRQGLVNGSLLLNNGHEISREEIYKHLFYPQSMGVTIFSVFDSGSKSLPMGLRFVIEDKSIGPNLGSYSSMGFRHPKDVEEKWEKKSTTTELLEIEETCATTAVLTSFSKTGVLTYALSCILNESYLYSVSIKDLLRLLSAFFNVNGEQKVGLTTSGSSFLLEMGQYVDLDVPIGRILCAPI